MATSLHFNLDDLNAQAQAVEDISSKLKASADRLSGSLDSLRGDWSSTAGAKFFSMYDTAWIQHIDKYCAMLNELAGALRTAEQSYSPLEEQYNRINL